MGKYQENVARSYTVYPIKLSAITDMFRKQKADETLQDYIQYFIDQTETA